MQQTLRKLRSELTPVYGHGETEAIIRLIFNHVKGWSTVDMLINENKPLSSFIISQIDSILDRLKKEEPIQYIVGQAYFYGMDFKVTLDVLIPRPETEELVDMITHNEKSADLRVLDIGTGSGCIAIALSRNLLFPKITAIDVSEAAINIAQENAKTFSAKIDFKVCDIFSYNPDPDSLDIIVSNPPYIDESEKKDMHDNVLLHEPPTALFVPDRDPLVFYRRIGHIAIKALAPGRHLYFEINPRHADELSELLSKQGFDEISIITDIHGRHRFIKASRPSVAF